MFWFYSTIIQDQKQNKTKSCPALIPYVVPYASPSPALDLYLKGWVPRRGEQSPIVIISYKGYSPPKCSCNHQTPHIQAKICTFLLECLHVMDENMTHPIPCPKSSPTPSHKQMPNVKNQPPFCSINDHFSKQKLFVL